MQTSEETGKAAFLEVGCLVVWYLAWYHTWMGGWVAKYLEDLLRLCRCAKLG